MARSKGSANFAGSLEVLAGAPLDARTVVNVKADLTDSQSYTYVYVGMIVSVKSEGKAYILTAADFTDSDNWSELGSGGSGKGGVVEGYFNPTDDLFYEESAYETAITGESGMLYVSLDTNRLYRFNGTIFVVVSDLDATVYQPAGSVLFANLPAASAGTLGFVYDIQDDFVTTSDFIEGAGKAYSAGTNVVVINHGTSSLPIYKYDVLSSRTNLPTGGTTGQVLAKKTNTNYDVEWTDISGLEYEEKTLVSSNNSYNNANLVSNGETKIFHSYWEAGLTVSDPHLPNCESNSIARHFYTEMTKASDGLTFTQHCRVFYTKSNVNYVRVYDRRCTSSGGTWTYPDWIELTADASLPVTPNQFDKANMYSTTEKVVGSWTDGRPLYQKTVSWGLITSGNSSKNHNISNINAIIDCKGYWVQDNTYFGPIGEHDAGNATLYVYADKTKIYFVASSEFGDGKVYAYITLQYTKTTDAANSFKYADENDYSTTEKIVGTWIDGKPLYQKTISCGALPNATGKTTSTGLSSSTHRIRSLKGYAYRSDIGSVIPLPNASSKYLEAIAIITSGTYYISLSCATDFSKYTESYVTIQYTKTTD